MPGWLNSDDDFEKFLGFTDNEVLASLRKAAYEKDAPGHDPARRIEKREHFKKFFELTLPERQSNPDALREVASVASEKWGKHNIREHDEIKSAGEVEFPVGMEECSYSLPAQTQSPAILHLPDVTTGFLFIEPTLHKDAKRWIMEKRKDLVNNFILGE